MNLYSAAETTANYIETGISKVRYGVGKMLLLGLFAGAVIAFAAAVTNTATHGLSDVGLARLLSGLLFPFGLAIVVLGGAELFTGSCLLSIPLLAGRISPGAMLKNWVFVYIGNFAGALIVAAGCAFFGQLNYSGNALAAYTIKVAAAKCALPFANALVMGIFCNLLVCLGVFLALCAKDAAGRTVGAYLPVAFFVICGFEHCVANMYYVPAGLFAARVPEYAAKAAELGVRAELLTWGNFFVSNLLPVTIGNIIGGVAIGAMMWAAHLRRP
jgi:formate/nitrite transporter